MGIEEKNIKEIIEDLSLEEKASLCSGQGPWATQGIAEKNIPSMKVADGPHGLRVVEDPEELSSKSIPATCYPTASALASSWNKKLINQIGKALGREAQSQGVNILLGPGVNLKRSPLCGRNFEYFSEDPYLTGELGAAFINGVQSQGVGTSLKHFACNNQETDRMTVDARIDERTLKELYLTAFREIVKNSSPWTVMSAYNKLNGIFASENHTLLTEILREKWSFEGLVVSDWGAVNDRVEGIKAGLDLEMPGPSPQNDEEIIKKVKSGELDESLLDKTVFRYLKTLFKAKENEKENTEFDKEKHHKLARKAAVESIVLLKNEDNILPIQEESTDNIAVIGRMAKHPKFQGSGSSKVNSTAVDIPLEEIKKLAGDNIKVSYAEGYEENNFTNTKLLNEAETAAAKADTAVLFVGLTENYESEGYDRDDLKLPEEHIQLIRKVAGAQKNTVVVLNNGAPVSMNSWQDQVSAVVEGWLSGQAGGGAIADILLGEKTPSGKLAETFPQDIIDNPSYLNFPGEDGKVIYGERIFIGYRYYEKKGIKPLYPFGHGLSYTTFKYSDLDIKNKEIYSSDVVEFSLKISNTGNYKGKETVQVYLSQNNPELLRPEQELKDFQKVELEPGEEKEIVFEIDGSQFGYYNPEFGSWITETDQYQIRIGSSSEDIRLKETININDDSDMEKPLTGDSVIKRWLEDETGKEVLSEFISEEQLNQFTEADEDFVELFMNIPLRKLSSLSGGNISQEMIQKIVNEVKRRKNKG